MADRQERQEAQGHWPRNINLGSNNNGFRRHCWFNEKGQVYGQGILVVVLTTGKKEIPINFAKEKVRINF